MDVALFFGLTINLFVQLLRKGQMHMALYKELKIIDENESYGKTALTGTFFKYPMTVIPFVERFEGLKEEESKYYKKLKSQNYILWISILSFVGFFVYVFVFYE